MRTGKISVVCLISLLYLFVLTPGISQAVTYNQYAGPAGGSWNTAANWALSRVPTTGDKAGFKTVGGPLVSTSTPACGEWTLGGTSGGIITINSGGTVSTVTSGGGTGRVSLGQAAGENGTLQMNGGTATFAGIIDLGYAGTGHINLDGGTINAADFAMRAAGGVGTMDITAGTLIITGDKVSLINGYIASGWITGYSGSGTVNVSYNTPNAGKTTVTATSGGGAPTKATNPNPSNGATGIATSPTLTWTAGSGATSRDVYFGTDSTPDSSELIGSQSSTSYSPGTLANNTIYYWRIDEKNASGTTTGDVWSFTTTGGGGGATVYPYLSLRGNPTNSIMVNWFNLDAAGDSSVDYGPTSSYGSTEYLAASTNYHHVELTGLNPGQTYHYRVRSNDGTVGADNTFTTAVANETSFSFAVYGDARGASSTNEPYYTRHQALCNWLAPQNLAFALTTGDTVWEGGNAASLTSFWTDFFFLESNLSKGTPMMTTLGNHEVQPTGAGTPAERYANYKNFYAAGYPANGVGGNYEGQVYSFNYGNAHIICLSSYQAPFATQTTWLAADLAAADADPSIQWIFVFMHSPMYTTSSTHPPDTDEQAAFLSLIDQYHVDIVFAGHNHVYERSKSLENGAIVPDGQGTVYITNGMGGANFDPISSHSLFVTEYNSQTVATVVSINGNSLTVNTIPNATGVPIDTFTLSYGGSSPSPASNPNPSNGATSVSTTADLSWSAGSGATSRDVYFGTDSTPDSSEFMGNQAGTTFDTGTMASSTTYYWRIDEKNAYGTTTGSVWSFTTAGAPQPPGKAASPNPTNGATNVNTTNDLSWAAGSGATSHDVYFGTSSPGTFRGNQAGTTFDTATMANNTTYYWRIDEKNANGTTTGDVWSFTTAAAPQPPSKATSPNPANGATSVSITNDLSWTAGSGATSHDVYFGTSSPGTFRGNQAGTTFDTGTMAASTTYYWRIDEKNAAGTTTGDVWSFTTGTTPPVGSLPFSDGFESGNFTAGGWTTQDADASITSTVNDRYAGTYGAKLRETTWMQKMVSTVGYNTIHVKYARKATGLDSGQNEKLFVEWSIDGSTWNNLETVPTAAWAQKDFTCGSGANNNANFRVRFRINANATSEFGAVDSVEITGTQQ